MFAFSKFKWLAISQYKAILNVFFNNNSIQTCNPVVRDIKVRGKVRLTTQGLNGERALEKLGMKICCMKKLKWGEGKLPLLYGAQNT